MNPPHPSPPSGAGEHHPPSFEPPPSSSLPLRDRSVLVTGGTGSIGGAIVRALLLREVRAIHVVGRDETRQVLLRDRWPHDPRLRWSIGDVRDVDRMRDLAADADIVFHAAAMKHVGVCEQNPSETLRTNVGGTEAILAALPRDGLRRFVLISTDKAVQPRGVLGASKRRAERVVIEATQRHSHLWGAVVRLGNVLGSRGSVLPRLAARLRSGHPLPLPDGEVTRFVMTADEAANASLAVLGEEDSGSTFVPQLPAVSMRTLLECWLEETTARRGIDPGSIERTVYRLAAEEKCHEWLLDADEAGRRVDAPPITRILPIAAADLDGSGRGGTEGMEGEIPSAFRSDRAPRLSTPQVRALLVRARSIDDRVGEDSPEGPTP